MPQKISIIVTGVVIEISAFSRHKKVWFLKMFEKITVKKYLNFKGQKIFENFKVQKGSKFLKIKITEIYL